ncbi:hypothetical protein P43SY_004560 [Pythium insidiosum]|uniref:FYVE-type domain-containing protein n=1 Tax=Pythium insidiosum TaxID=114742 RepID=A0AAD5LR81_PYTIN|nr:hypothetical protein P43SY_004560 [Pythium insidiosum]
MVAPAQTRAPAPAPAPSAAVAVSGSVSQRDLSSAMGKDWTPPSSPVVLDASQRTALLDQIAATVAFVLECVGPTATVVTNWKVEAKRSGMTFFEDHTLLEAKRSRSSPERFCCVEHTTARVEDVLQLFVATDNAALQRHARVMHSKLVETRLLSVLHAPSDAKPWASTYVQYTRVRSSPWRRDRDLCAVVATDCLRLRDGSTLGYCLWDSVDLESLCPDLLDAQGVWRTRMRRSGYVLHNSGRPNAKTKILYLCGLDPIEGSTGSRLSQRRSSLSSRRSSVSQHVSSSASFHALDQIGGNLDRICSHFRRRTFDVTHFVSRADWSPPALARCCCSCNYVFTLLSRRSNCMACGDIMCSTCCRRERVDVPGAGLKTLKICAYCIRGLEDTGRQSGKRVGSIPDTRRRTMQTSKTSNGESLSGGSTASEDFDWANFPGATAYTSYW